MEGHVIPSSLRFRQIKGFVQILVFYGVITMVLQKHNNELCALTVSV